MINFLCDSFYWDYYLLGIILIPGIIFALIAQNKVNSTFDKYANVMSESGRTASEVAKIMLNAAGCTDIQIAKTSGHLTDNYNHSKKTVSLSNSVYDSTSVAAIGVAAHEIGHVLQYKAHYLPIKLRTFAIHISNISSVLMWPLVIVGLLLNFLLTLEFGYILALAGVVVFGLSVIVNLVTLPVEYNASKRATEILGQSGLLTEQETAQAKQVLDAAALTYVAALVVSILNLLRFLLSIRSDD